MGNLHNKYFYFWYFKYSLILTLFYFYLSKNLNVMSECVTVFLTQVKDLNTSSTTANLLGF